MYSNASNTRVTRPAFHKVSNFKYSIVELIGFIRVGTCNGKLQLVPGFKGSGSSSLSSLCDTHNFGFGRGMPVKPNTLKMGRGETSHFILPANCLKRRRNSYKAAAACAIPIIHDPSNSAFNSDTPSRLPAGVLTLVYSHGHGGRGGPFRH